MTVYNFSAGPAILPREVIEEAAAGVENIENGLSILEISHRGPKISSIAEEAESLLRELYKIPENYSVLFLSGGASSQFFMVPMNILDDSHTAAYVDTGNWSAKAVKEAKAFGHIDVIASSKEQKYDHIPEGFESLINQSHRYCHITTNNTVAGTQFLQIPDMQVPLVADSSSDFLSRPVDISKYDIIYAGAQKNLGPAGVTVVIIKKDILGKVNRHIPTMLNYQTHIDKGSMFNTPPVFPIYVSMLTMRWLKKMGGLQAIQKHNEEKAKTIYDEIDRNTLFQGRVVYKDRSLMNATFTCKDEEAHASAFLDHCEKNGISGIKGHRSVGGFRASIYNAMPKAGVNKLVEVMQQFESQHG